MASNGEPGADYYVLLGRLKIQQKSFIEAEENLKQAIVLKHQVRLLESCFCCVLSFFLYVGRFILLLIESLNILDKLAIYSQQESETDLRPTRNVRKIETLRQKSSSFD